MSDPNPGASPVPAATPPAIPVELAKHVIQENGQFGIKAVVDGESRFVPLDLAVAHLQKMGAADNRLAKAAELQKSHQTAIQFWEETQKGLRGDQDAARRALAMLPGDLSDELAADPEPAPVRTAQRPQAQQFQVPPEMAEIASFLKEVKSYGVKPADAFRMVIGQAQDAVEQQVYSEVDRLAAGNDGLSGLLKDKAKSRYVLDELHGRVRDRIRSGEPDGPQTYLPAIREVAEKYKHLGISTGTSEKTPAPFARELFSAMGLGPSSSAGAGTDGNMDLAKRPDPITPLRGKPGEYARNFAARFAYDVAQKASQNAEHGEAISI